MVGKENRAGILPILKSMKVDDSRLIIPKNHPSRADVRFVEFFDSVLSRGSAATLRAAWWKSMCQAGTQR
jgi:hypothetical protein